MCVRETVWVIFHWNENRLVYALCLCRPARARHFPIFSAPNKLTNGLTVRGPFFLWESFSQNYRSVIISIITVWSIFPLLLNIKLIVTMTWQAEMIKKNFFFFKYPDWEETNDYRTFWPPRYVRRNRKGRRGDKRGSGGWQADLVKVRGEEVLGFDDDADDVALFKVGGKGDFDGGGGDDGEDRALVKLRVSYCDFTITAVIPILQNRQENNYHPRWGLHFQRTTKSLSKV